MPRPGWLALAALVMSTAGCSARTPFVHQSLVPIAPEPAAYRLVLVGDAGELRQPEPVLTVAAAMAGRMAGRVTVLYLGDNAYPAGISGDDAARRRAEETLTRQFEAVSTGARVVFLPGNHDWAKYGPDGLKAVERQAAFVRSRGAEFLPAAGCPGPEWIDLPQERPVVRVIALDTQWWLHRFERGAACSPGSPEAVVAALRGAMATSLPVVVAAHHPLATHGEHGGFFDWRTHLFPLRALKGMKWAWMPLPGLGSLYLGVRSLLDRAQDFGGRANASMRAALRDGLSVPTPPLVVYAAGHDHSLQVLKGPTVDYTLVSGAGASHNQTAVGRGDDTLFAHETAGFMVLDVVADGFALAIVDAAAPDTQRRWFRLRR